MATGIGEPTVLLADDDAALVEMYETFLEGTCDVITTTEGDEVLGLVDASVDVVLLDRRMPGTSGDEVLAALRERGYGMPVGMVSGIHPDSDIIEMPLDDYVTKPLGPERLRETVERLVVRAGLDDQCRELLRLASKKAALGSVDALDREDSEAFEELVDRVVHPDLELDPELERLVAEDPVDTSDTGEFLGLVRDACTSP